MKKKTTNENVFSAVKKFTDAFFDGLKNNQVDSVLAKARAARLDSEAIEQMERIKREKEELDKILSKIPKAKL